MVFDIKIIFTTKMFIRGSNCQTHFRKNTHLQATFQHQEKLSRWNHRVPFFGAFGQVKIKLAPTVEPVEADGVVGKTLWGMPVAVGQTAGYIML